MASEGLNSKKTKEGDNLELLRTELQVLNRRLVGIQNLIDVRTQHVQNMMRLPSASEIEHYRNETPAANIAFSDLWVAGEKLKEIAVLISQPNRLNDNVS